MQRSAIAQMKGEAVWLTVEQAQVLLEQFKASATLRDWRLLAVAIMSTHFHLVVATAIDFDPAKMLQEFKANGSRAMNQKFAKPAPGTWWTKSGSKRKLKDEGAIAAAVNYVLLKQPNPLVTWRDPRHHD